jgi:hypothetical protein
MRRRIFPYAHDLAFEPELAPLALVEAALAIAVQALIARNPELLLGEDAPAPPPQVLAARSVIACYRDMQDAIERYRDLLPPPYEPVAGTDDIPF